LKQVKKQLFNEISTKTIKQKAVTESCKALEKVKEIIISALRKQQQQAKHVGKTLEINDKTLLKTA
jgi:transcriptional regulator with PAS, ATPase and Fis domain